MRAILSVFAALLAVVPAVFGVPAASALETLVTPTSAQKGYVARWTMDGSWNTTNAYFTLTGTLSVRTMVAGVAPYFRYGFGTWSVNSMASPHTLATCSWNCNSYTSSYCSVSLWHYQAVTNRVYGEIYLAEIWIRYAGSWCSPNGDSSGISAVVRVLYDASTLKVLHHTASNSVFYSYRNGAFQLVSVNGNNLDYYRMNADLTWTLLGSVSKPATFQAPSTVPKYLDTDAFSDGVTQPVFFFLAANGGHYAFLPYAADSPLVIRMDTGEYSDNSLWDSMKDYFGWSSETSAIPQLSNKRPYGIVEPADDNFLIFSASTASGTSFLTRDLSVHGHFPNETSLVGLSSFLNPKAYFARTDGTTAVWDAACVEPGYDICAAHASWGHKCQNSLGNLGPNAISCNAPIDYQSYSPGSGGSTGSGSTGSGSSGTYPQYPSTAQDCRPKAFSGSFVSVTTSANLDPSSCAWRTANGAFRCQDAGGHACITDGDSCFSEILNPSQYSSGSVQYSGDVTRYECSVWSVQCRWYSKSSCGPTSLCYQDGEYCRVKPGEDDSADYSGIGEVSFSGAPVPDDAFDMSNLGAIWTGSSFVSGISSVGSFSGVAPVTQLTESGFCDMFNSDGSFAYYSDWRPFAVTISAAGIVPIGWVEENVVPHVDRLFASVTAPVNNLGAILRVFWTFPEGSKVCVLGRVAEVRYQSALKSLDDTKHFSGFQYWRMGFFDYVFLLVFGVIAIAWLRKSVSNMS